MTKIAAIKAKRKMFLTGTPAVNRPIELQPLAGHLDPVTFGDFFAFAKRYCAGHHNGWGWDFSGASNLDELQQKLRSTIMIRRLKEEVLTELPPKVRQVVVMQPAGASLRAVSAEQNFFAAHHARVTELSLAAELTRITGTKEEYEAAVKRLREAETVGFDQIAKLRHDTAVAKVPQVVEHVTDLLEGGVEKLLVFVHHRDVSGAIKQALAAYNPMQIMGGDAIKDRDEAVRRFQNDPTCRVGVLSIQAAGVGLTLTHANTVVFAELDWVPGNISQAEDRAHRIGQTDSVHVQHLVLDGSIDARLAKTIVDKQAILDKALDLPSEVERANGQGGNEAVLAAEERIAQEREAAEERLAAALNRAREAASAVAAREAELAVIAARQAVERIEARVAQRENAMEARPVERRVSKRTIEAQAKKITPEQIAAVHRALNILAGQDEDRAAFENGVGFNKADGALGHALAGMDELDPRYAVVGRDICKRYRRQLGDAVLADMGA